MLKFQTHPDRVFIAILQESMSLMIDQLREVEEDLLETEVRLYNLDNLLPHAGRVFNASTALYTLRQMLKCLRDTWLYALNDFHYLLLYDTLQYFCEIYNDITCCTAGESDKKKGAILGDMYIDKIYFDKIIGIYFYDIDFLLSADTVIGLGLDNRECLGIQHEAFSISQGLSPHYEELKLKICDNEDPVPPFISRNWSRSSTVYPYHEAAEE